MKTRKIYDPEFKQMAVDLGHHRDDIGKLAEEGAQRGQTGEGHLKKGSEHFLQERCKYSGS